VVPPKSNEPIGIDGSSHCCTAGGGGGGGALLGQGEPRHWWDGVRTSLLRQALQGYRLAHTLMVGKDMWVLGDTRVDRTAGCSFALLVMPPELEDGYLGPAAGPCGEGASQAAGEEQQGGMAEPPSLPPLPHSRLLPAHSPLLRLRRRRRRWECYQAQNHGAACAVAAVVDAMAEAGWGEPAVAAAETQ
jgi:hypothetical protein